MIFGAARPACRAFEFERDTFAFPNELVWQYRFDDAGGATTFRTDPPPTYAHRCFVLVRSARQFLHHARFDPAQSAIADPAYRAKVREVVSRNPRRASSDADRIVLPGYPSLRAFSQARPQILRESCGGAWQSYVLRSHWRMVFPISRRNQEATARQLGEAILHRPPSVVHVVRFPQLTINHGLLLFGARATSTGFLFDAYDPNIPERPAELTYETATRTFFMPRNHYWAGGRVDVIEIYRNWMF